MSEHPSVQGGSSQSFKEKRYPAQCPHCKALILHEDSTFCKKCGEFLRKGGSRWWNFDETENK